VRSKNEERGTAAYAREFGAHANWSKSPIRSRARQRARFGGAALLELGLAAEAIT
jgi:hypothetical protein